MTGGEAILILAGGFFIIYLVVKYFHRLYNNHDI